MMKNLRNFLKVTAVLLVLLFSVHQKTYATHAMGADIVYKSIGNNKFVVTWEFYFDCSSAVNMYSQYQNITMNLHSSSCAFDTTFLMHMDYANSDIEVTPVCPSIVTQCPDSTHSSSTYPGVKKFTYVDTLDLHNHYCNDFYFFYGMSARNGNINTISGNPYLTVFAFLNDSTGYNNSSPNFSILPTPFICEGQTYCYNNGSNDIDGDSLSYSLMTPLGTTAAPTWANLFNTVTFNFPFDSAHPVTSTIAPSFDSSSGTFCIDPTAMDIGIMAILVKEYRHGVLVGMVERDIQINVITCTNNIPTVTGIDSSATVYADTICSQVPYTFTVYSNDLDPADTVSMWWSNSIPGATFTIIGTPHPHGVFNWTPPASAANTVSYCFTVTVRDNACPYEGIQTKAYCLRVVGANIGFTHGNVCTPTVTFHDTSTIGAGTITGWHWYFADTASHGFDTSNLRNPIHTFSDTGWFNVRLVTTSSWGCNDTAWENIHVRVGQLINASSTNSVCSNSNNGTGNVIITSGGVYPFTYHWSNGDTTASIGGLGAGTYYVTVTDSVGCQKMDTITVTAPPPLISSYIQHNIYCHDANNSGLAATIVSGGTGPYHYTWSPSATTLGTASNLTANTYNVTITDAHGCVLTHTFPVTQQYALGVDSAQTDVRCFGANTGVAMVHVFSQGGTFTYAWTPTLSNSATVSNLLAGNYYVIISDTSHPACKDSVHFHITSPTQMVITLDTATAIPCNGYLSTAVVVDTGGVGGYLYTWSSSPVQHSATATNLPAANYTVTVTDANGCTITTSISITQPTALVSTHAHTDVVCFGGSDGTTTVNASGGITNYNYSWTPSGGTNANATGLNAGQYTVLITDMNGCTHTDTVTVNQPPDLIATPIPANETICADTTIAIGATGSSGSPGYTYSWSNGVNNQFQNIAPTTTTTYTVTVTDSHGCTKVQNVNITVNSIPQPLDSATSVCWGDSSRIWVWNAQPGWHYNWINPAGTNSSVSFLSPITVTDSVQITDANGCKSRWIKDSAHIRGPHVIADYYVDSLTGFMPLTVHFTDSSQNSVFNVWTFNDLFAKPPFNPDTSTYIDPTHIFDSAGTYPVTLVSINNEGCMDTITKYIIVKKKSHLVVYNTFSPNGDHLNDEWWPEFKNIKTSHIVIFNRWGLKVKEWTTLMGWDGTDNGGSIVPDGTYYYVLSCQGYDNVNYNEHGYITVIR